MNTNKQILENLGKIYFGEVVALTELPKLAARASDMMLVNLLQERRAETENQVTRILAIFQNLKELPTKQDSQIIREILEETYAQVEKNQNKIEIDLAIIGGILELGNFEAAMYEKLILMCKAEGLNDESKILEQTLGEEMMAAKNLLMMGSMVISSNVYEKVT